MERRATAKLGVQPRAASPCLDDLANYGKPDPGALDLVTCRQRLKDLPDSLTMLRRDARTIIGDRELKPPIEILHGNLDPSPGTLVVLYRVPDEVHEYLLEWHALRHDCRHAGPDDDLGVGRRCEKLD